MRQMTPFVPAKKAEFLFLIRQRAERRIFSLNELTQIFSFSV